MDRSETGGEAEAIEAVARLLNPGEWWDHDGFEATKAMYREKAAVIVAEVEPLLAQRARDGALTAIDEAIRGELDLHQCSFDELPEPNKRFVQGMRRAREWVVNAAIPITAP